MKLDIKEYRLIIKALEHFRTPKNSKKVDEAISVVNMIGTY